MENICEVCGPAATELAQSGSTGNRRCGRCIKTKLDPPGDNNRGKADRNASIVSRFSAGESISDLVVAFSLSVTTVRTVLRDSGCDVPKNRAGAKPGKNAERDGRIVDDYVTSSDTCKVVGERWGLTGEYVREIVSAAGANRSREEVVRLRRLSSQQRKEVARQSRLSNQQNESETVEPVSIGALLFSVRREWWYETYNRPESPSCITIARWILGLSDTEAVDETDKKFLIVVATEVHRTLRRHGIAIRPKEVAVRLARSKKYRVSR